MSTDTPMSPHTPLSQMSSPSTPRSPLTPRSGFRELHSLAQSLQHTVPAGTLFTPRTTLSSRLRTEYLARISRPGQAGATYDPAVTAAADGPNSLARLPPTSRVQQIARQQGLGTLDTRPPFMLSYRPHSVATAPLHGSPPPDTRPPAMLDPRAQPFFPTPYEPVEMGPPSAGDQ